MKKGLSKHSLYDLLLFSVLFVVCLALAFNLNFHNGKMRYPGVFYSDRGNYYVYLPATFIYGWDARKFPKSCDTLCGGFYLNGRTGKVEEKMTCGIAILWTPFFLATHAIATVFDLQPDGFSGFYQKAAVIPPVFFLVLGLFFLKRFLEFYFRGRTVYLCLLFVFAGTNLFYYGLVEGLMSHVHSFFLFSLFLFLVKKFLEKDKPSVRLFAWICLVFALSVLIRPTNAVILFIFFFLDAGSMKETAERVRRIFKPKFLLIFFTVAFLVFLPQFLYWKYLTGHYIFYSYRQEGFSHWKDPFIFPVWFSPLNGLFLYTPLALLFAAGFILMIFRRRANGFLLLLIFALVSYTCGSWHMWFFGGSFGFRPFVEYYAIFSLGFGFLISGSLNLKNLFLRSMVFLVMIFFSYANLRMTYSTYWHETSIWGWDEYKDRIDRAGILSFSRDTYTFMNDFEHEDKEISGGRSSSRAHSGNMSGMMTSKSLFFGVFRRPMAGILDGDIRRVKVSVWVNPAWRDSTHSCLIASVEDQNSHSWSYHFVPVNSFGTRAGKWTEVTLSFKVPEWLNDPSYLLSIYFWNPAHRTIYIDDSRVKFE